MKIAILTTDTLHHAYYVKCIKELDVEIAVFQETTSVPAPFEIYHPFEKDRDDYEKKSWFNGQHASVADFTSPQNFETINAPQSIEAIIDYGPDLTLTFGTRKILPTVIKACGNILNLHGGDPQEYRGLDTHLWSIYHNDFNNLKTCLHVLDKNLDTGNIVDTHNLKITPDMPLFQLRASNTETCVSLSRSAIETYLKSGKIPAKHQSKKGRYYSFMPPQLKDICVTKFANYTKSL